MVREVMDVMGQPRSLVTLAGATRLRAEWGGGAGRRRMEGLGEGRGEGRLREAEPEPTVTLGEA